MSKWKMKLNTNAAHGTCMWWIERKEISIKHAKNYTINDTSHQNCIAVHLRIETEIIICRRHRYIYWSAAAHLSISVSSVLARLLTHFFASHWNCESERNEERAWKRQKTGTVLFKTHNTHKINLQEWENLQPNGLAAMYVFVGLKSIN